MALTLSQIKSRFDTLASANESKKVEVENKIHGGDTYWFIYGAEGKLRMFQATKDLSYLNSYLDHWFAFQDGALASNTFPNPSLPAYTTEREGNNDQFNDNFLTWDNHGDPAWTQGWTNGGEYPLFETHGFQNVPLMLSILYHNPEILEIEHGQSWSGWGTTYQDVYDSVLSFFETNVWDKWDINGSDPRTYSGSGLGINEALMRNEIHISSHASTIALYLWKITGKQKYKDFLDDWNFDTDGHGYNSRNANGFVGNLRNYTYTEGATSYVGFIWDNVWGTTDPTSQTDTDHWKAEFRHISNQLMFSDNWWDANAGGTAPSDFRSRMLETAKWAFENSQNGAANYRPLKTSHSKDGTTSQRSTMIYFGTCEWGRYDETFQSEMEDSSFANTSTSSSQRYRAEIFLGNLAYNRAYLNGDTMYLEFPNGESVETVTWDNTTQSIAEGESVDLSFTLTPSTVLDSTYTLSSSNTSVVSNSGEWVGVGSATLTITMNDTTNGVISDDMAVTSTATSVTSVVVTPSSFDILVAGTVQLNETVLPSNATDKTGSWSTSNASVATVSSSGLVTGVGLGTATITFTTTDGSFIDTSNISVVSEITDSISSLSPLVFYSPTSIDSSATLDGDPVTIWEDISGNNLDATSVGSITLNVSSNRQVEFNGSSYFDIPNDASLNLVGGTDEFTLVLREGDVQSLSSGYLIGKASTGPFTVQYGIAYGGDILNGIYVGNTLSGFTNLPSGPNRLIIAVVTTTTVNVWINGIKVLTDGPVGTSVTNSGQSANIGGRTDGSYLMDSGSQIDLVAIIPSAINDSQRLAIESQYDLSTSTGPLVRVSKLLSSTNQIFYYLLNGVKKLL